MSRIKSYLRNFIGAMYGIPATVSMLTSIFSQQSAVNAGFEEFLTINFSDLVDKDENGYFSGINTTLKIMGKRLL